MIHEIHINVSRSSFMPAQFMVNKALHIVIVCYTAVCWNCVKMSALRNETETKQFCSSLISLWRQF